MVKFIFKISKILSYLFIIFALILNSCSENPTITGYGLLNPVDSLIVLKFDSTNDSVFVYHKQIKQSDPLGVTRRILVGRYNDITAYSLIRFQIGLSSELREAIKNSSVTIASARLKLNPVYKFGDTTSNSFSIIIKEIKSEFNEYTFTIDSLKSGKYSISNENIAINNIDNDTLYYCGLNTSAVLGWFRSIVIDSVKPQGILLEPESSTQYIKGFASSTAYYTGNPIVLEVVAEYNSKVDSLIFYVDSDLHVVDSSNPIVTDDSKLVFQSGIKIKSYIYFDISKIPTDAVVTSAILRLYLDSSNSFFGTSYQDSLMVQFITDSSQISIDSAVIYNLTRTDSNYYEGQINYYVQKWIDNNSNKGLLLSTRDPDGGVDKFVFYGPGSALFNKRPQLIINYSRLK